MIAGAVWWLINGVLGVLLLTSAISSLEGGAAHDRDGALLRAASPPSDAGATSQQ